jgi:hypothetical protein
VVGASGASPLATAERAGRARSDDVAEGMDPGGAVLAGAEGGEEDVPIYDYPAAHPGVGWPFSMWAGHDMTCAVYGDGSGACWGEDPFEYLTDGHPVPVPVATSVLALQFAGQVGASARPHGQLRWEVYPRLGRDGALDMGRGDVVGLATADQQICVLFGTGEVGCTRHGKCHSLLPRGNSYSEASDPPTEWCEDPVFEIVDGVRDVAQLAGSVGWPKDEVPRFCALKRSGRVTCWEAAPDLRERVLAKADVPSLDDAVEITLGQEFGCARRDGGRVACWGYGPNGELGRGARETERQDVRDVSGIEDAVSLAAGDSSACVATVSGLVYCWGSNRDSRLGIGRSGLRSNGTAGNKRTTADDCVEGSCFSTVPLPVVLRLEAQHE